MQRHHRSPPEQLDLSGSSVDRRRRHSDARADDKPDVKLRNFQYGHDSERGRTPTIGHARTINTPYFSEHRHGAAVAGCSSALLSGSTLRHEQRKGSEQVGGVESVHGQTDVALTASSCYGTQLGYTIDRDNH